ncbi:MULTISPECIES: flavodoxin family protein [Streptomyces]|uniref:Flavodoxin family protein n=1 Tax=Streptomyces heilongjiangensis TaxID=945052 RepID=A0ABW1B094_9ACTN|nr:MULTISPECIES: flavodoxin family protein [Streptomyces]MDC2945615.1 flavodoxin family protein [Streptomyces heilongjiangensis]
MKETKEKPFTVLAVSGSEHPSGTTADVLNHAEKILADRGAVLDVVHLGQARVTPCGPCGDCNVRLLPCAVDDDVAAIVQRMIAADGILYAAPVHGFGTAALMQSFIERAGVGHLRFTRPLANKVAGVIVTGRRYSHTEVYSHLVKNALLNRMILVGSGMPPIVYSDEVEQGDTEGLDMVRSMLDRMVDMIRLLREHRALTGRDGLSPQTLNERQRAGA